MDGIVNLAVQPGTGVYGPGGQIAVGSVGTRFKSIVTISGRLKVTQDYHPSAVSTNMYEDLVTMENIGGTTIGDLRYRRVMDWDISPFTFSEYSEIHVGTSPNLVVATSDGFRSGNPLSTPGPFVGAPPTTLFSGSPDYLHGPADQGALFDFRFGSLAPGAIKQFKIFYGAAGDRAAALAAIVAVGGEMYSLGLPRHSDTTVAFEGPHAFIFAFSGVGGVPVGDVALAPATATNFLGAPHTLTATIKENSVLQVGKTVTFTVISGPNTGVIGSAVSDGAGVATISYTSSLVGTDNIRASFVDSVGTTQLSNVATKTWISPPNADLELVSKVDDFDPVFHGDLVNYTITVTNHGPAAATNVKITDTLPPGLSFVSGAGCSGGPVVTCLVGSLAVGSSATMTITVHTDAAGTFTDSAHVSADQPDTVPGNNDRTETTTVLPLVDLAVTKVDDADPVLWGAIVTYTITVTNNGPDTAHSIDVTDSVAGVGTFVSGTAAGGPCTVDGFGLIHCPAGDLAVGGSTTVTLLVHADSPGTIKDKAHAQAIEDDHTFFNDGDVEDTLVVVHPTAVTYTGDVTRDYNDPATLSAQLVDASNLAPIPTELVALSLDGQSCLAATDLGGNASCTITPNEPAGSYPLTAAFAGDGLYAASSASGSFAVTLEETTTVYTGASGPIANGSTVTLSGVLKEDGVTPISGRTLTLALGTQTCTDTTNLAGAASCSVIVAQPVGPATVGASFAGDAFYLPSSDSKATLIYSFATGGGAFVVGNLSASGSVTFWGAQWWKIDLLSTAAAPASFKGFAKDPATPSCGTGWTTRTGDSPPPPAPPLASYIGIIVSSSISQSGSVISGNTVHIVVVATNPGYDANPGHAGTGTVVATVC